MSCLHHVVPCLHQKRGVCEEEKEEVEEFHQLWPANTMEFDLTLEHLYAHR